MSTNKTQNYNLHSWVPEDDFLRSEFNDNFTGIDTALKTLNDAISAETQARIAAVAAETQARTTSISSEQSARANAINTLTANKAEITVGFYTGNGAAERTITLGFQPKAVLLVHESGRTYVDISNSDGAYGGLFLPGHPLYSQTDSGNPSGVAAEVVSTGFKVYTKGYAHCNDSGAGYCYLAVK